MVKKIILGIILLIIVACIYPGCMVWTRVGQTPRGERLERIKKSPNFDVEKGVFVNRTPTYTNTGEDGMGKGIVDFLFSRYPDTAPDHALPYVKTDLKKLDRNQDVVVWLGHSSVYIQVDGIRYLFDPVLTNSFPSSMMLKPYPGTDIYTPDDIPEVDYLVITHDHWDHLDYQTVMALKDRVKNVVCGLGVGQHFEYWGYDVSVLHEMDWGEDLNINDHTTIHCLSSRHFSGRMGGNKTLWASFLIDGKRKIYVSGDGGYDNRFKEIGKQYPDIELAIMENGQYNKNWNQIHMLPDQLPVAIEELSPKYVFTYHHGKYTLSTHAWYEPLEEIYKNSQGKDWRLLTPKIGQAIDLRSPGETSEWWRDSI